MTLAKSKKERGLFQMTAVVAAFSNDGVAGGLPGVINISGRPVHDLRIVETISLGDRSRIQVTSKLMSHDVFDWVRVSAKLAWEEGSVVGLQLLVHWILPQIAQHLPQGF